MYIGIPRKEMEKYEKQEKKCCHGRTTDKAREAKGAATR
jgi:hypothetical protein